MFEAIMIKLLSCMLGFLFEQTVQQVKHVQIDGAPNWYYRVGEKENLYVYAYQQGGLDTVEEMRPVLEQSMNKEIKRILAYLISENFSNIEDPREKRFLDSVQNDEMLMVFIQGQLQIDRIKHVSAREESLLNDMRPARTFASAYIQKRQLLEYYETRLNEISKQISELRSDDAFRELEGEPSEKEKQSRSDELFGELDAI